MDPFLYNQRNEGLKCLMFHFIVEKIINYENWEHLHNYWGTYHLDLGSLLAYFAHSFTILSKKQKRKVRGGSLILIEAFA